MILNKSNEVFEYEDKKYKIGDKIVATAVSDEYEGLIGHITEIRDGDDKDTENETPDIYCAFYEPIMPCDIQQIEERFSESYGEPKKIEDIILDIVIMAPEMIEVITDLEKPVNGTKVYVVTDDWAYNDEYDSTIELFADLKLAKAYMRKQVRQMEKSGGLFDRRGDDDCVEESSDLFYEIYIEGWYCSSHYSIKIQEKILHMTTS
jgi:hypothetical protein